MLAAVAALWIAASPAVAVTPMGNPTPRCTEDQSCWTWPTMGNHKRGVITMWGTPKTVTCGDMRWLVRHRDLDPRTPRLRGDEKCGRRW